MTKLILALALGVFFAANLLNRAQAQVVLNDPGFTLNSQDIDKQWSLVKTGFTEAWAKSTGTKNVIVAIVDTGIDATHEDLQSVNFVPGYNVLTREVITDRINSDDNGHGTLIAGILGATANNQRGIVGASRQISLMPIKALDENGRGDSAGISEGIIWAVDNGAQIINLSLGGISFGHDKILAAAIAYAFRKNVVIVAAAGNDAATEGISLDDNPIFPVCEDNGMNMVIGVAAVDQNDIKPAFSNFGKNCIDVVAPGKRILSTINHDPITKIPVPNAYAYASGTSLAAPFVSAQAALLKALYPHATNMQIRDRILASADPVDALNLAQCAGKSCRGLLGAGRINVKKSIDGFIENPDVLEGDLVRLENNGLVYFISGGRKQLVSSFVYNQRFLESTVKNVSENALNKFPEGSYALPLNGTLVKTEGDPTVYYIKNGLKLPITLPVFQQRQFRFSDVQVVSFPELHSWITGSFLSPLEGTIVITAGRKNLFWVVGETFYSINRQFIMHKGIQDFPSLIVPDADLDGFAKGGKLYY